MKVKPEEIKAVIKSQIENYGLKTRITETGYCISSGDGIARVYGLSDCMSGELLIFENGIYGMAVNIEEDNIGCVLMGDNTQIREGSEVVRTKKMAEVPVGEQLLGRVVDSMGHALDGKGKISSDKTRPIEFEAAGVIDRKSVDQPLQTGILAIDSMVPIGRGQRELIIGDRQTGKTSIAVDAILNQKGKGVVCVYVAIGQKASTTASIVETFKRFGAMDYTIVVCSSASDSVAMQYFAPYSGCAMAEYFMYQQKQDALIVYDDLSKHAVAYRAMSLILGRPPGREAYPGDVFYLHSRLLERAARVSDELGGASITALPIIETLNGDFSAYVPTNVISITDGQIYLQSELFFSGQRPAVNVGMSVSRVGGNAQTRAMKKVAGSLRINLAQYRDLEVFAQFGSDLDQATQDKLAQGERIMETLKQPVYSPISVEEQVIMLYLATGKALMSIPVDKIKAFLKDFLSYINANHPQITDLIAKSGQLSSETEISLNEALSDFVQKRGG